MILIVLLARYNRGLALRPVNRIKHVVDFSGTVAKNVILTSNLIIAVDAPVIGNESQVVTASKVHGIYLKVLCASNEATVAGAIPNVYLSIQKNPGGAIAVVDPRSVGDEVLKKYVIHQEMSMIENRISGIPTVLFDGVIKIPRGYIRNGPGDALKINFVCTAIDTSLCFQCHYKEFR